MPSGTFDAHRWRRFHGHRALGAFCRQPACGHPTLSALKQAQRLVGWKIHHHGYRL